MSKSDLWGCSMSKLSKSASAYYNLKRGLLMGLQTGIKGCFVMQFHKYTNCCQIFI